MITVVAVVVAAAVVAVVAAVVENDCFAGTLAYFAKQLRAPHPSSSQNRVQLTNR